MPSPFDTILQDALWPSILPIFGETMTHEPQGADSYSALLVYDDGDIIQSKGGRIKAVISGPTTAFTVAPLERDVFVRETLERLQCVEVEDDGIGGYRCWCRLASAE